MTPTTSNGYPRRKTFFPKMWGSAPNWRCQAWWLSTNTGEEAMAELSSGNRVLPNCALTPSVWKKFPVTNKPNIGRLSMRANTNRIAQCPPILITLEFLKLLPGKQLIVPAVVGPAQAKQTIGIAHRQRTQHVSVKDGENRSVEAQAYGNDGDDRYSKQWAAPHTPKRIASICPQRLKEINPPRLAALFSCSLNAAELEPCLPLRFIRGEIALLVVFLSAFPDEIAIHLEARHQISLPEEQSTQTKKGINPTRIDLYS